MKVVKTSSSPDARLEPLFPAQTRKIRAIEMTLESPILHAKQKANHSQSNCYPNSNSHYYSNLLLRARARGRRYRAYTTEAALRIVHLHNLQTIQKGIGERASRRRANTYTKLVVITRCSNIIHVICSGQYFTNYRARIKIRRHIYRTYIDIIQELIRGWTHYVTEVDSASFGSFKKPRSETQYLHSVSLSGVKGGPPMFTLATVSSACTDRPLNVPAGLMDVAVSSISVSGTDTTSNAFT
nr:hypothetical protein Iba_chr08aCG12210 [Ipomoea batatas]